MAIPITVVLVWKQILLSLQLLRVPAAQASVVTLVFMTAVSAVTVPDNTPGISDWIVLLLVVSLSTVAVISFMASRHPIVPRADRQYRETAAVTIAVIALILNLFFNPVSTLFLGVGMFALTHRTTRLCAGSFPWVACAILVTLVPWWVWTALDSWDAGLLILLPLAALAHLGGNHMVDAYASHDEGESSLSKRAHRLGAWMAILLGGILIVVAGVIGSSSYAWISLGGIIMAISIAIEAGIPRPGNEPGKYASVLCEGAFFLAALCWLVSIT